MSDGEVEFVCRACGATASRTPGPAEEVRYCSPACARRAARHRKAWRVALRQRDSFVSTLDDQPRCIATRKVICPSKELAWAVVALIHVGHPKVGVYRCQSCRYWHYGNGRWSQVARRRFFAAIEEAEASVT